MQRDHRPTERFSDRVADYARYRPGYPPALARWLFEHCGLRAGDAAADIGAGTGLFTKDLLALGLKVFAVEPNAAMRTAAEAAFAGNAGFVSGHGTAEATGLPAAGVKLACAAQAFHWFDVPKARDEFRRILVPGGQAALIWNVRRIEGVFAEAYERLLLAHCPDYAAGMPEQADEAGIAEFFGRADVARERFDHAQRFDYAGLQGRLLSSSYTPPADDPRRAILLSALRDLFDRYAENGAVSFEYDSRVFVGTL